MLLSQTPWITLFGFFATLAVLSCQLALATLLPLPSALFLLFFSCFLVPVIQDSCPSPPCPGCPHSKPQTLSIPLSPLCLLNIRPGLSGAVSCSVFLASSFCPLPHWPPSPSPPSCSVFRCSSPVLACAAQPQPIPSLLFPSWDCSPDPDLYLHTHARMLTIMLFKFKKPHDYLQDLKASAGFRYGHCSFAHATRLWTASAPLLSLWQPQLTPIYSQPAPFTPGHCTPGASLLGATRHPQPQTTCPCLQSCTTLPRQGR